KIGAIYKDEADLDVAVDDSTKEEVLATQEDIISAMELLEVNDVPLSKKPTIAEIAVHIPNSKISGDAVKAAYDVYIAA
ncbi:MAG: hypothetical protein HRU28_18265, partial [Rhizobiales bacterium]|nr:hypothetical protein [Hyphomicrobiales bacterium]